ncbi:hypothetical protein A8W25_14925 [Streptomyces sp. ERV7]|nr:hypothetical protein A8W25_14925 [Streptomyces sp. ERV7]
MPGRSASRQAPPLSGGASAKPAPPCAVRAAEEGAGGEAVAQCVGAVVGSSAVSRGSLVCRSSSPHSPGAEAAFPIRWTNT